MYPPPPVAYYGPPPWEVRAKRKLKMAIVLSVIGIVLALAASFATNWYVVESVEEWPDGDEGFTIRVELMFGLYQADASISSRYTNSGELIDSEFITEDYNDETIESMEYHAVGGATTGTVWASIFFIAVFLLVTMVATASRMITGAGFIRHGPAIAGMVALTFMIVSIGYFAYAMPVAVENEVSTWEIEDYTSGLGGGFYAYCFAMALVIVSVMLTIIRTPSPHPEAP